MISQAIIGYRTWAITLKSKEFGLLLLGLGLIVTVLEWYTNLNGHVPDLTEVSITTYSPPVATATDRNYLTSRECEQHSFARVAK